MLEIKALFPIRQLPRQIWYEYKDNIALKTACGCGMAPHLYFPQMRFPSGDSHSGPCGLGLGGLSLDDASVSLGRHDAGHV